ncbi:hypothetical protein Pcinc_006018 [Petrolisthes cinctipes]|uniref:Cytochrome P450 n=1 Tax=Petrolisthes cinctipes TaxID=88211 RepID=A0AAE1GDP7_PETCI|nr:hypothetical protein Pcinc_006018 [Petrolisthes cinctipes]
MHVRSIYKQHFHRSPTFMCSPLRTIHSKHRPYVLASYHYYATNSRTVIAFLCSCAQRYYKIPVTRIRLRVGDEVIYSTRAVQRDSRFWQNPDKFQPDRFLPHNINNNPITPCSFLPFGMGPRNCIAMRFGLMEVKVALSKLLLKAELKLSPGHENIKMKNWSIIATPVGESRIVVTPIN